MDQSMEYWEFLLQKEGDRSWLPLEGPIAGILEGRYRIIARSSYGEAPVTLRVSYQDPSDLAIIDGPQEHSRSAQTNKDGLMVVLPFTSLKPGEWRFFCSSDDFQGEPSEAGPWHYELCLQVDPYEGEPWIDAGVGRDDASQSLAAALSGAETAVIGAVPPKEEFQPEPGPVAAPEPFKPLPEPAIATTGNETVNEAVPAESTQEETAAETFEEPVTNVPTIEEPKVAEAAATDADVSETVPPVTTMPPLAIEETEEAIAAASSFGSGEATEDSPMLATLPGDIQIRLSRSTYITAWGANITLSGTLEPAQQELLGASIPATCQLNAILRDPATQQILVNLQMPLLQALDGDRPNQVIPLPCSFSFPVELPIETSTYLLLGELNAHSLADSSEPPLAQQAFTVAADIDVLAKAVDPGFSAETCSNPDQIPGATNTQLPTFATPGDQLRKNNLDLQLLSFVSAPDGSVSPIKAPESDVAGAPAAQSAPPQVTEPQPVTAAASPQVETPNFSESAPRSPEPTFRPLTPPAAGSSTSQGTRQGRFWSRLSAFAQTPQGNWLEEYQTDQAAPPKPEPSSPDSHLTEREILIDPDLDRRSPTASTAGQLADSPPNEQPFGGPRQPSRSPAIAPVPSIPTPTLTVPAESVVVGEAVSIHLQVDEVPGRRIGLKFWIQDRQTRQLLEPPRWVLDPTPNGRGKVESRVTVTVPPGLIEVQFEAIAIDLESQHTGQKASESRQCLAASRTTQYYPLPGDGNQLFGSDI